jgi:glyoxylate reductase
MTPRLKVLVMHPLLDPAPALLAGEFDVVDYPAGGPLTEEAIADAARGCAAILSQVMDPIGERVLSVPGLRIVANVAVGYDNIDLAVATRHGVFVTNTPGVLDETTADLAFALLMTAARRVAESDRFVRAGRWSGWAIDQMLGQDVHGATLGIVGLGRIGQAVAKRASGFGMRVLYADARRIPAEEEQALNAEWMPLDDLLREADFVTLHVPLSKETHHLIGAAQLNAMKPSAVLVNASRGPVVDTAALAAALREGSIFAAGLDVYEHEPEVPAELIAQENVVLAPHIGSASVRTRSRMCELAARNVIAALRGERPPTLVNREVEA